MVKFSYKPPRLCFLVAASLLFLSEFALAEDRSQLFQSFEIEGLSVGLSFAEAVSKAELREYRLVNPDSRQLTKKEADGSGKSLTFTQRSSLRAAQFSLRGMKQTRFRRGAGVGCWPMAAGGHP